MSRTTQKLFSELTYSVKRKRLAKLSRDLMETQDMSRANSSIDENDLIKELVPKVTFLNKQVEGHQTQEMLESRASIVVQRMMKRPRSQPLVKF